MSTGRELIEIARKATADPLVMAEVHTTTDGWIPVTEVSPHGRDIWLLRNGPGGRTLYVGSSVITAVRTTPPISEVHIL